jgi:hypothetical protein
LNGLSKLFNARAKIVAILNSTSKISVIIVKVVLYSTVPSVRLETGFSKIKAQKTKKDPYVDAKLATTR